MKSFPGTELLAAALGVGLSLFGCSGSSGASHSGPGGAIGGSANTSGGGTSAVTSSQAGTSGGSAGAPGSAGAGPVAGTIGPGAGAGAAGSSGVAGSVAGGGSSGVAGGAGASGTLASGGSVAPTSTSVAGGAGNSGGTVRTGGTTAAGGTTAGGGTTAVGGTIVAAGTTAVGGTKATGGATSSGGATVAGGSKATGGTTVAGGVIATGGGTRPFAGATATPGDGTPVLISSFDISKIVGTPGMRLGDINGDGKMEIVMGQPTDQSTLGGGTPQIVVCATAFDLKGNQLWQYGTPGQFHGASSDIPIQVYDMDGDGKAEVFAAMDDKSITVIDGTTGKLKRTITLPATGSNDCIIFANLRGTEWPQDIIVKDRYTNIWAIVGIDDSTSKAGTLLWTHKGTTGHFPLVHDWDGDGKDEVMGGYDYLESDGKMQWSTNTTSSPALTMHADAIATADVDGNPANGYEILIGGNHAALFDWKTGKQYWQDTNTVENQQMGIGEYRSDSPGLEVVLLDRIGPRTSTGHDANVLLSSADKLFWKESRTDYGWITVTENMNNWDGKGTDLILSYHRGGQTPATLYDGNDKVIAQFPHTGNLVDNAQHADLCGDGKEEVIVYNESKIWIFSNGACNLDDPPVHPSIPQQFHLHNWSEYTGWVTPDVKFYTPGSAQ